MGLRISFFKTPKHRVFNYSPIFYDERKEKLQERIAKIQDEMEREKAEKEGLEWENKRYIPGKNIRGKFRESRENNRRHAMKTSTSKIIGLISIGILFVLIYYFANYFDWFMKVL